MSETAAHRAASFLRVRGTCRHPFVGGGDGVLYLSHPDVQIRMLASRKANLDGVDKVEFPGIQWCAKSSFCISLDIDTSS